MHFKLITKCSYLASPSRLLIALRTSTDDVADEEGLLLDSLIVACVADIAARDDVCCD